MKSLMSFGAAFVVAVAAGSASAVVTPTHFYRLGEADPGAVAGNVGNATTIDSVGGVNLTQTGSPVYVSGNAASPLAMDFNGGSAQRYSAPVISTLQNNFGIEAWVRSDTNSANRTIAYNGNSGNSGWGIYQIGNTYQGLFGGLAFVGSAPNVPGMWTHLALVRDNGTSTLYVNGIARGTNGTTPNVPAGTFQVGGNFTGAENFDGRIDEVRTFTFAPGTFNAATDLSNTAFTPQFSVVSHYRLGENDPGSANGNVGNAVTIDDTALRNLNRFGSPVYTGSTPGIVSTRAMDFSGASGEHYTAGPVITTQTDNWVLEGWFNADTTAGVDILAYNGNTSNAGFGLIRNGNEWQGLFGGVVVLDFDAPVVVDQWTHLALVRELGATRLFVNGLQVGGTYFNGLNTPAGNFMIGGNPLNAPEAFDGQIDEVRLSLLNSPFNRSMLLLNENVVLPEPAAMSLVMLGGAALGLRRRRQA